MPKVKLGQPKRDKLRELICGVLSAYGPSGDAERVAGILGCSLPTARKRIREPKGMPVDELLRLTRGLGIPLEEVRAAITY